MPRARKTQTAEVAPGETYGRRQELEEMAASAPVPAVQGPVDPELFPAARDAATAMPPPEPGGLLSRPPRGDLPMQAGLSTGPGPGPEAVNMPTGRRDRLQRQLRLAAEITGNERLVAMAEQAAMRPMPRITRRRPY